MLPKKDVVLIFFLFSFTLRAYSQSWLWAKQATPFNSDCYGVTNTDRCVAADTDGNIYLTGIFRDSLNFSGSIVHSQGRSSAFLIKHDASGNIVWARQSINASSASYSVGNSVATDALGNIYMVGYFVDTVSFAADSLRGLSPTDPNFETLNVFLVKYDAAGNILWARQSVAPSSTSAAWGYSVAIDPAGNPYISGSFHDTICFGSDTLKEINCIGRNGWDAFIAKYDANGNVLWARQSNIASAASTVDWLFSITIDAAGNLYTTGGFKDTLTIGAFTLISTQADGIGSMYLVKYDASGNVLWARQSTGPSPHSSAIGSSVATDGPGNIYVTGYFTDTASFSGNMLKEPTPWEDVFFIKYDPLGNVIWAKQGFVLSNGHWQGMSVACDTTSAGGGYLVMSKVGAGPSPYILKFGADTFNITDPGNTGSYGVGTVLLKFDSAGNIKCYNDFSEGVALFFEENGVATSPSGKYICLGSNTRDSIVLGDSLFPYYYSMPFVARWNACCGNMHVHVSPFDTSICYGSNVIFNASGGTSYSWSTGATTNSINVSPVSDTTYQLIVKEDLCVKDTNVLVKVLPVPQPSINAPQTICAGNSVYLSASGGTSYSWAPAIGLSSIGIANPVATPTITTNYTVAVSNGLCTSNDSVKVTVVPMPIISVCCNASINAGQSMNLSVNGGGSYSWAPADGLSCISCDYPVASPLDNTTYTVTVTSDSGCVASQTISIDVSCHIFVPNAFSPNGDGQNDLLLVKGPCISYMLFTIYDRWGNRVYSSSDINAGWDGKYNGMPMNEGTYVYELIGITVDGGKIEKKGNITLVR
jgi:gliding motility-associated-like protein